MNRPIVHIVHHCPHAIAIDIYWGYNPFYNSKGRRTTGYGDYQPGVNPYAILGDSSVVKIFKKYGWTWGGDWTSVKDYMHFQWYGNGNVQ